MRLKLFISVLILSVSTFAQVTVDSVLGPQIVAVVPFDYAQDGTEIPIQMLDSGFLHLHIP